MSYTSNYTGAQVDSAVGKTLNQSTGIDAINTALAGKQDTLELKNQ